MVNAHKVIDELRDEYGQHAPAKVKAMYDQVVDSGERPEVIEGWRTACKLVGVRV